jgi:hypothetical protein
MAILTNLTELVTDVREIINEETEAFWTDVFIKRQLEKGHKIISSRIKLVNNVWTATLVTGDPGEGEAKIVDDREIRLPEGFINIDDGGIYYNDENCTPTTIQILKTVDTKWLSKTGTPTQYYLRGDMLGFNRQISAGDTIRIYGAGMPTELADATNPAPFEGDKRTEGYRSLLVDYAIGMCWKKKNAMDKHAYYLAPRLGVFWQGLEEMKEELLADSDEDYGMIPDSNPAHYYRQKSWPDHSQFDH